MNNINPKLVKILDIKKEFLPTYEPKTYMLTLDLEGSCSPHVSISVNNILLFNGILSTTNKFCFEILNKRSRQMLSVTLHNKNSTDTIVDAHNNIIADKYVKINSIHFDNIHIRDYIFKARFKHLENNKQYYTDMLTFNGTWRLYFKNPPLFSISQQQGLFETAEKKYLRQKYFEKLITLYSNKHE